MTEKTIQKPSSNNNSIEFALARLETIVADIESNPPTLEILMERYEEGVQLLKVCQEKLTAAEERIEIITRNARGEAVLSSHSE
ncbi:MAG: exodeoxyribonuclease VII small subunit [Chthoniobacterales bacterium]